MIATVDLSRPEGEKELAKSDMQPPLPNSEIAPGSAGQTEKTAPGSPIAYDVPFPIPTEFDGRPVTGCGVHWGCQWYHGDWTSGFMGWGWQDWIKWARSMHLSWAVLLTHSDSALVPQQAAGGRSATQVLLDGGIIPFVRFDLELPRRFVHGDHVKTLVSQVSKYEVPTYVLIGNEFSDSREWRKQKVPKDWMAQAFAWWIDAARTCIAHGSIVGFPDGPDYPVDVFRFMKDLPSKGGYVSTGDVDDFFRWWEEGKVFYAGHHYGLNRPPDYPDDPVSREGIPLTKEEHQELLGPFYKDGGWRAPRDLINRQRAEKAWAKGGRERSELTACFRSWERVQSWMKKHFGKIMPMAMTEGGWTPGAIAGTTAETIDDRWPKPTPEVVAQYTMYALEEVEHSMFALCPWAAADRWMNGPGIWEGDAWRTATYQHLGYGLDMPIVEALRKDKPPAVGSGSPPQKIDTKPKPKPKPKPKQKPKQKPKPQPKPEPTPPASGEEVDLTRDKNIRAFLKKGLIELDTDGDSYKLVELSWLPPGFKEGQSKNLHHIYVDVVDRNDERLFDEKVQVSYSHEKGGIQRDLVPIEKPKGEPGGNFQMFASMGGYTVEVATTSGTSDKVKGLGMGTPEHPGVKEHTSFILKFRKL